MPSAELWKFLPLGYALTVAIELPVLLLLLDKRHGWRRKVFAAFWLTACTYPIVVIVLPLALDSVSNRTQYLIVAETFAPVAECALFYGLCRRDREGAQASGRDLAVIVLANLLSFGIGELLHSSRWLS